MCIYSKIYVVNVVKWNIMAWHLLLWYAHYESDRISNTLRLIEIQRLTWMKHFWTDKLKRTIKSAFQLKVLFLCVCYYRQRKKNWLCLQHKLAVPCNFSAHGLGNVSLSISNVFTKMKSKLIFCFVFIFLSFATAVTRSIHLRSLYFSMVLDHMKIYILKI